MRPQSNQPELPAVAVTTSATQPPVQDSAVASSHPRCCRNSPTRPESASRSWSISNSRQFHQQRQHQQSVAGGQQVIHNDPQSATGAFVHPADGRRLDNIEEAEQAEGGALPREAGGVKNSTSQKATISSHTMAP